MLSPLLPRRKLRLKSLAPSGKAGIELYPHSVPALDFCPYTCSVPTVLSTTSGAKEAPDEELQRAEADAGALVTEVKGDEGNAWATALRAAWEHSVKEGALGEGNPPGATRCTGVRGPALGWWWGAGPGWKASSEGWYLMMTKINGQGSGNIWGCVEKQLLRQRKQQSRKQEWAGVWRK